MPDDPGELAGLERRREELYRELRQVGDFRRGSLNEVRRKCGKPNCACAAPGHRGHGPQYNLTRSEGGRTRARHLRPGPELEKVRREVAGYERFRDLVGQVTEVNEAICEARPVAPPAGDDVSSGPGGEKRGSSTRSGGEVRRDRPHGGGSSAVAGLRRGRPGGRRDGDPRRPVPGSSSWGYRGP